MGVYTDFMEAKKVRVFIRNFGKENFLWTECLQRNTIAVLDDEEIHRFWELGDRDGYVAYAQKHFKAAGGARYRSLSQVDGTTSTISCIVQTVIYGSTGSAVSFGGLILCLGSRIKK